MPRIEVLEMKDTFGKLLITEAYPEFVNALRRTMLADVPKMAIHEVEFQMGPIREKDGTTYEGITPLFDEVLAHRLAMLPIPTYLDRFNFRDKCVCQKGKDEAEKALEKVSITKRGCANCTITYIINKRGPCVVYSGDLEPKEGGNEYRIKPDLIPIVELAEGQALFLFANAILGTGKHHAKWQAAQAVGYKYYPIIKYDPDKCVACGKCIEVCPKEIFTKSKDGKASLINDKIEECTLCQSCVEECSRVGANAITVKGDNTRFIFRYETDGALKAKDVLVEALNILADKYNELRTKLSEAL